MSTKVFINNVSTLFSQCNTFKTSQDIQPVEINNWTALVSFSAPFLLCFSFVEITYLNLFWVAQYNVFI